MMWNDLEAWERINLEQQYRDQLRQAANRFDVFLSYSTTDKELAERLHAALSDSGAHAFLACKSILPGDDFADRIRDTLALAAEFWILVMPNSIRRPWVLTEIGAAWALGKKIVPILYACDPEQLPDQLRRLHSVDFEHYPELISKYLARQPSRGSAGEERG